MNDLIIDEIEQLTNDTETIALNVNNKLSAGTNALYNAKVKKAELRSNVRKADLTISLMNKKIMVDKSTLYIIILLLAIIDIIAILKKWG